MPYKLIAVDDTTKQKSLVDPGSGSFSLYPAGETLAAFRMVALVDGELVLADQSNVDHAGSIAGMTLASANTGETPQVQRSGMVTNPAWSWTAGELIYLADNGLLTQDGTTTINTGFLLPVGWVPSSTRIWLEVGTPTLLSPDIPSSELPPKEKFAGETLDYLFDWVERLDGATISSSTITAPSGVTLSDVSHTSTTATVTVSGGTVGITYPITNTITRSDGLVEIAIGLLVIVPGG